MITLFGPDEPTLVEKLKKSVSKTSSELSARVESILTGGPRLDPQQMRLLENALLSADLGVATTRQLLDAVRASADRQMVNDASQLRGALKSELLAVINAVRLPSNGLPHDVRPQVIF